MTIVDRSHLFARRPAAFRILVGGPKGATFIRRAALTDSAAHWTFVKRLELVKLLSDNVREPNEYSKLHIRTAVNVPSGVFGTSPPEVVMQTLVEANRLAKELVDTGDSRTKPKDSQLAKHLIFHCNLSLIRGPASADRTTEILSHHHKERDAARPLVSVLDGGYAEWKREYKHDAKLMVGEKDPS
ncbi:hypothetical protein PhCBS80983_g02780 [Powellomyces hirtus]|uniref:Rhodanese domain-containing protein n=1 Tax=Powellomyces hirtus TaxID=109895 RepID=A0A507E6R8_9FUNG|nr:hypothetical protein PhCBS80983_g02780 [Powellomyces hirtus]